ncbi:hypothetical protein [Nocardioides conyzicola]|uniref:Uncharacterized protein n=1 Tax=Nocardioides conyzicola TaxID=1651781 RepID=A0ABP8X586_9ACTN
MTVLRCTRTAAAWVATLIVVTAGLVGCSSDDSSAAGLCDTANDYVWYVGYFTGDQGGPPSAAEIPGAVDTLVDLTDDLAGEVPSDQREGAKAAHETWTGAKGVFERYDLADDSTADQAAAELQAELGKYQDVNERFVAWLRDECGFDSAEDLERPPGA